MGQAEVQYQRNERHNRTNIHPPISNPGYISHFNPNIFTGIAFSAQDRIIVDLLSESRFLAFSDRQIGFGKSLVYKRANLSRFGLVPTFSLRIIWHSASSYLRFFWSHRWSFFASCILFIMKISYYILVALFTLPSTLVSSSPLPQDLTSTISADSPSRTPKVDCTLDPWVF